MRTLFLATTVAAVAACATPAQAGLIGTGTNRVEAFFYNNGPGNPNGGCDQQTFAYCEWQYNYDAQNMAQYNLAIPAHFVQGPNSGSKIDVEDKTITITNEISATFCADGMSGGSACTDIFTGFEFIFSSGVDITNVTVDGSSAPDFRPNDTSPHEGIHEISPTDFFVDVTGAAPRIGDKLVLDVTTAGGGPATPEPSTWAMMLLGFAGLGFAASRRTRAAPQFG